MMSTEASRKPTARMIVSPGELLQEAHGGLGVGQLLRVDEHELDVQLVGGNLRRDVQPEPVVDPVEHLLHHPAELEHDLAVLGRDDVAVAAGERGDEAVVADLVRLGPRLRRTGRCG